MKNLSLLPFLFSFLLILSGCTHEDTVEVVGKPASDKKIENHSFLKAHFIYAGQADATLLQWKNQDELFTMLIDAGDWDRNDVVNYLQNEKIQDIDLVVVTHPHSDHIGQLDLILDTFHVEEVWMNGDTNHAKAFEKALEAIEEKDIEYYEPRAGDSFEIGDVPIDVLHPANAFRKTNKNAAINNNSIVMRIQYGDVSFLFTGDAEQEAEAEMLKGDFNLNADILHVGHHGADTSSSKEFLEAVNAEIAIYSAGIDNSYGLPDGEVLDRLKNLSSLVYGTDQHGTITLETDGQKVNITTEQEGNLPPPIEGEACTNINSASPDELQKLMHIDKQLAKEIIKLRPYQSLNELRNIDTIDSDMLQDIKEQKVACIQ